MKGAKFSGFVMDVEVTICLVLYNFHDCTFKNNFEEHLRTAAFIFPEYFQRCKIGC